MRQKKIGLALGGGAARGLAHIGVLEVLEKEGIPIDMIAGTSAGAAVGALYAQGKDTSAIKSLATELTRKRMASLTDLVLPRTGLIRGKKIRDLIESIIGGDLKFSDLKMRFACVAADIMTGEEIVFDHGSVLEGVRASISIPVVFTLHKWQGRYLVDGGLVNPVPVSVLKERGMDFVIAVNVIPSARERGQRSGTTKEPRIIDIIMQSFYITTYWRIRFSLAAADVVIEPQVAHIAYADFHRANECIALGAEAAQEAMPEIRRRLQL